MVRSCSLKNCSNSVKQKYRFFVLPSVKKVAKRTAWLRKCGHLLPENLPTSGNSISLCEGHFEPDQFVEYGPNIRTILKPTAVPTIFTRNPPRVCDAVALKYIKVLEKNVTDPVDTIPYDISSTNPVEDSNMMDISENDDNTLFSNTPQKNDTVFPLIVDPNLSQVEKELLTLSDSITPDENESTVKLLRIKKNCMLVSTPIGNKIVPAGEQQIINQPSPPVEHPVLSIDYDNTITTDINVDPPFSLDSNDESTLEILPTIPEPLKQVVINSESSVESQLPEVTINSNELSSSPNTKVFLVDNNAKKVKSEFPISEQENLEPHKVNVPKIVLVKKPHELNKIQVMTKVSKKPVALKLTPVLSPKKSSNISVIEEKQVNETHKKNITHEANMLEQILTDSSDLKSDSEPVDFYSSAERNIEDHETSVNSNNSDQDNVTDNLKMLIKQTVKPINDDVTSVFFPSTNNDPNFLKKRIHELESERDYAIRKYRRLAMKMEIFYKNMRLFLTDDQIRSLETDPSLVNTVHWSLETLQRSAKIRSIIGPRGYEYLRNKEHFPLPSFRTLYRHKDISKLNEYTDEMIRDHMNNTIDEVASSGTKNLNSSDDDIEIEKEILPEHIKLEVLEDEQEEDIVETIRDIEQLDNMTEETNKFGEISNIEVVKYVTINTSKDQKTVTL
ncbi:uncharacterized protein [Chelonus insularis]|uniref:uncharacterized protein n=1 Tax=Chelonus insularis TaxID=460826 RepID=UPI00158C6503|nr:uncharacterized protein LOC118068600 [Chelonus insularis]